MTLEKEIGEAEYFHVQNGPVLPSLLALRAYLRTIPQQAYDHHVTQDRNDFATWIEHVFGEKELADRLKACKSREEMVWAMDDAFSDARMAKVLANQEAAPVQQKAVAGAPENAEPVALQEDGNFDQYKAGIVGTNERISAKYDEISRRLHDALIDAMPQEIEKRIEQLKGRHAELSARISEARKQGHDALIPALIMRQFNGKLALAKATRDEKDFKFAELVLDQAEFELKEVMEEKIIDVKKEIQEMMAKQEK